MELKDVIPGQIYFVKQTTINCYWLLKIKEIREDDGIDTIAYLITKGSTNTFKVNNGSGWGNVKDVESIRPATSFEKEWMEECIRQNKYVPQEQIKTERSFLIWN